ncbi:PepSY domain-containing protein [Staphylococcus agnetis]|uniref:PepSY domain-containing protein n=1 Tax=Staphylococcus agnetis TaxID=985762 RepID=UPI00208E7995|nr:PepSY domain-containing protein [Staphylococcus agnetis]MCO4339692.1 PepSY domain-containing protein [Staphylococcus agnetis]MCO4349214.1 PepSY domain-containing protein [Staphylococcus agnetis]
MRVRFISALTASIILLGACGNNIEDNNAKSNASNEQQNIGSVIELNKIKNNPDKVVKQAQKEFSGQNLTGISFENSNGQWVYKIEQQKMGEESEVAIADSNNKILNKKAEKETAIDKSDEFEYSDAIIYKEAVKKAQKEFNGDIKEWSLSKSDGKLVYDLKLQKDDTIYEIKVNAKNGKILNKEHDD